VVGVTYFLFDGALDLLRPLLDPVLFFLDLLEDRLLEFLAESFLESLLAPPARCCCFDLFVDAARWFCWVFVWLFLLVFCAPRVPFF